MTSSGIVSQRIIDFSTRTLKEADRKWFGELETILIHLSLSRQDVIHIVQLVSDKVQEAKKRDENKSRVILRNKNTQRILRGWVTRHRFRKLVASRKKLQVFLKEFIEAEALYLKKLYLIQQIKDGLLGKKKSKIENNETPVNLRKSLTIAPKNLSIDEAQILFSHAENLLGVHKQLTTKLYTHSQLSKQFAGLIAFLKELTELQRYYLPFMQTYAKIVETLRECLSRKKFKDSLLKIEARTADGMTLSSLFAAILYRIDDYSSAVQVILRHCTGEEEGVGRVHEIFEKLRKFQREAVALRDKQDALDKTLRVHHRISNFPHGQIIPPTREFVHEGFLFYSIENGPKNLALAFLFNDLICFTSTKSTEYLTSFPTQKMLYKQRSSVLNGDWTIELKIPNNKIVCCFPLKDEDREVWLKAFDKATEGFRLFGVPLIELIRRDNVDVPVFFSDCVKFLSSKESMNEEGLFRISAQRPDLEALQQEYDQGNRVNLSKCDVHTVAGIFKLWFKSLPHPLLLGENEMDTYNEWISLMNDGYEEQIAHAKNILNSLPAENQRVTLQTLQLLRQVSKCEAKNKMNPSNLAIVFSPILLHPREDKFQLSLIRSTSLLTSLKGVIETLITHVDSILPPPPPPGTQEEPSKSRIVFDSSKLATKSSPSLETAKAIVKPSTTVECSKAIFESPKPTIKVSSSLDTTKPTSDHSKATIKASPSVDGKPSKFFMEPSKSFGTKISSPKLI